MEFISNKTYGCTSGSSHEVYIELTGADIKSVGCTGSNDDAVDVLFAEERVREQLYEHHDAVLMVFGEVHYEHPEDYPTWEDKAKFVLWDACWNAVDGECDCMG